MLLGLRGSTLLFHNVVFQRIESSQCLLQVRKVRAFLYLHLPPAEEMNVIMLERQLVDFLRLLGDLLRAGQKAGAVRRDVDVRDVKAILSGCLAMLAAKPDAAELLTDVVLDGLRGG